MMASCIFVCLCHALQTFFRERDRNSFCGRYARSTMWSVAMGSGYILTLLPVSRGVAIASAVALSTTWMLSAGIGSNLPADSQLDPICPPTAPIWPRAVLLYGFLAYMVAARVNQDDALRRMFVLQKVLVAGRARLEAQAASLLHVINGSFPPHVLAFCINIAFEEHRAGSNGTFNAADSLLEVRRVAAGREE